MPETTFQHETVLLNEAVNALNLQQDGIYIDGTFGRGGHSRLILSGLGTKGMLLGVDRDPQAIKAAKMIQDPRFSIIYGTFSHIEEYAQERNLVGKINGVLLDLGVSSPQLDDPERGFSFMRDGPLDMRMDPEKGISAAKWLQTATEDEMAWVFKTFGEERFSKRIARVIAERNAVSPMTRTIELAELIRDAMPIKERHKHPATRVFQAIRIYINSELEEIKNALTGILNVLAPKGRLAVISFHSLEDRIVKNFIREHSSQAQVPRGLPLTEAQLKQYKQIELKKLGKIKATAEEIERNPRSRSAVLRVTEKI